MSEQPPASTPAASPDPTTPGPTVPISTMPISTQTVVRVGTVLWVAAFVVTLLVPDLHQGEKHWWPWACVTGIVLGCLGMRMVRRGRGNFADAE